MKGAMGYLRAAFLIIVLALAGNLCASDGSLHTLEQQATVRAVRRRALPQSWSADDIVHQTEHRPAAPRSGDLNALFHVWWFRLIGTKNDGIHGFPRFEWELTAHSYQRRWVPHAPSPPLIVPLLHVTHQFKDAYLGWQRLTPLPRPQPEDPPLLHMHEGFPIRSDEKRRIQLAVERDLEMRTYSSEHYRRQERREVEAAKRTVRRYLDAFRYLGYLETPTSPQRKGIMYRSSETHRQDQLRELYRTALQRHFEANARNTVEQVLPHDARSSYAPSSRIAVGQLGSSQGNSRSQTSGSPGHSWDSDRRSTSSPDELGGPPRHGEGNLGISPRDH